MKEKLYTIPVNEAFDKKGECPFCNLNKKTEEEILNYILGPSYMEEDVREKTDTLGFCKDHYRQMLGAGNRLGVALMLESHLKHINKNADKLFAEELAILDEKKGLFSKKQEVSPFTDYEKSLSGTCYACDRMQGRMDSYFNTFFHLWKTEDEFREKVKSGKGFCLEHFSGVLKEGKKRLDRKTYGQMVKTLIPIQQENMKRLEKEVSWFVQKFDYRFKDEPWKNSKNSIERGILKVAAYYDSDGGEL